ncbi:hypothetical protein [uncultured Sphaerotilus sp.]|uniref:hypothetical protein n=1 Tax=uncultured Sphaerotilus sp. TaxID=474984 RepID=UPI0030CA54CA
MPHSLLLTSPHDRRPLALVALVLLILLALAWHGPVSQWAHYHHFADARAWHGLPNAWNVLSNLPFALVGGWALLRWRRRPPAGAQAWTVFAAALLLTAFGSSYYHWAPDNTRLVFDRLPIAWACAALSCGFLAQRVDVRWAGVAPLAVAWAGATASVLYWWWTEQHGVGDLRPYLLVQFLPMVLVPAALWMRMAPIDAAPVVSDRAWWTVLALYGLAKLAESADAPVFEALSMLSSGHVLKHLLAAAAAGGLLCQRPAAAIDLTRKREKPRPSGRGGRAQDCAASRWLGG